LASPALYRRYIGQIQFIHQSILKTSS